LNLFDIFDRVVVINLERRTDRREAIEAELLNWPFKSPIFMKAIDGQRCPPPDEHQIQLPEHNGMNVSVNVRFVRTAGVWGCLQSHRRALEDALNDGCESVLILEDDAILRPDFTEAAEEFFRFLPPDREFVWLGGNHMQPPIPINPHVVKLTQIDRCHAYAAFGRGMTELYKFWHQWQHGDCDVMIAHWIADFNAYAPTRWLIGQRGGASDVSRRAGSEEQVLKPEEWWDFGEQVPLDRTAKVMQQLPCVYRGSIVDVLDMKTPIFECKEPQNPVGFATPWKHSSDQTQLICEGCELRPLSHNEKWLKKTRQDVLSRRDVKTTNRPILSGIMPTRGRSAQAAESIKGFYETTRGHDREFICISHPEDAASILVEMAKDQESYPGLQVVFHDADPITCWNVGLMHSKGFWLKIADDDLVYDHADWFDKVLEKHAEIGNPDVACFGLYDPDLRVIGGQIFTRTIVTRPFCLNVLGGVLCINLFKRWFNDVATFDLAVKNSCAHQCFKSKILHRQATMGLAHWDETAELGKQRGINDESNYRAWVARGRKIEWEPVITE